MRLARRSALQLTGAGLLAAPAVAHAQDNAAALRDLARRATIYLFPLYEMYRTRWQATVNDANPSRQRLNPMARSRFTCNASDRKAN